MLLHQVKLQEVKRATDPEPELKTNREIHARDEENINEEIRILRVDLQEVEKASETVTRTLAPIEANTKEAIQRLQTDHEEKEKVSVTHQKIAVPHEEKEPMLALEVKAQAVKEVTAQDPKPVPTQKAAKHALSVNREPDPMESRSRTHRETRAENAPKDRALLISQVMAAHD